MLVWVSAAWGALMGHGSPPTLCLDPPAQHSFHLPPWKHMAQTCPQLQTHCGQWSLGKGLYSGSVEGTEPGFRAAQDWP